MCFATTGVFVQCVSNGVLSPFKNGGIYIKRGLNGMPFSPLCFSTKPAPFLVPARPARVSCILLPERIREYLDAEQPLAYLDDIPVNQAPYVISCPAGLHPGRADQVFSLIRSFKFLTPITFAEVYPSAYVTPTILPSILALYTTLSKKPGEDM